MWGLGQQRLLVSSSCRLGPMSDSMSRDMSVPSRSGWHLEAASGAGGTLHVGQAMRHSASDFHGEAFDFDEASNAGAAPPLAQTASQLGASGEAIGLFAHTVLLSVAPVDAGAASEAASRLRDDAHRMFLGR